MTKPLTKEDIAKMTQAEKEDLASRMLNPVKWCGGYRRDDQGRRWYKHDGVEVSEEEHNAILNDKMRAANPRWTEEQLKPYLRSPAHKHQWQDIAQLLAGDDLCGMHCCSSGGHNNEYYWCHECGALKRANLILSPKEKP